MHGMPNIAGMTGMGGIPQMGGMQQVAGMGGMGGMGGLAGVGGGLAGMNMEGGKVTLLNYKPNLHFYLPRFFPPLKFTLCLPSNTPEKCIAWSTSYR